MMNESENKHDFQAKNCNLLPLITGGEQRTRTAKWKEERAGRRRAIEANKTLVWIMIISDPIFLFNKLKGCNNVVLQDSHFHRVPFVSITPVITSNEPRMKEKHSDVIFGSIFQPENFTGNFLSLSLRSHWLCPLSQRIFHGFILFTVLHMARSLVTDVHQINLPLNWELVNPFNDFSTSVKKCLWVSSR